MSTDVFDQDSDLQQWPEDDEPRPRRFRRVVMLAVALLALLLVLAGVAGVWLMRQVNPPGSPGPEVAVTVPLGSSTAAIAELLEDNEVITNSTVFRYYVRFKGAGPFEAGEYTFRRNQSMGDAVDVLSSRPQVEFVSVTIPEGLTLAEIAQRIERRVPGASAATFLELARSAAHRSRYQPRDVATLEGLLFPETYAVTEREDEQAVLRRMLEAFDGTASGLGYDEAEDRVGLSPYETIVVASLIEEEAKVAEDRAKISRVIHNRLAEGMRLQIDATVIYARGQRREGGRVLFSDLEIDSPYNTYRYAGLPPTPIAVPGEASLEAALNPAEGPWLYYVKYEENGAHAFSATLAEHNQRIREARARGVR